MDSSSKQYMAECFLRPIVDAHSTNVPGDTKQSKTTLKTELQVLHLSEESQNMCMETLRHIHGTDFQLDGREKYKDRGGHIKKSYWEDRGTLIVQSVTNYANNTNNRISSTCKTNNNNNIRQEEPQERLRTYALKKLQYYGFPLHHSTEAYDYCNGDTDKALCLLFRVYMNVPEEGRLRISELYNENLTDEDLLNTRNDEKEALRSIYDTAFEECETNVIWRLKFPIELIVADINKGQPTAEDAGKQAESSKKNNDRAKCRNWEKTGTCRFGTKCRFTHLPTARQEYAKKAGCNFSPCKLSLEEDDNKWFYVEIRFPPNIKYPYEAPFIFLKTTYNGIPDIAKLKIAQKLYKEAQMSCNDGTPCVYSVVELLLGNKNFNEFIIMKHDDETEMFPVMTKSLFSKNNESKKDLHQENKSVLQSHYQKGQTSFDKNFNQQDFQQITKADYLLMKRFQQLKKEENYQKMLKERQKLPAFDKMSDILELINKHQVLVISGETGCGKSTQVPQFILDNWFYDIAQLDNIQAIPHVEIICTQPRRLSVIGVANRVAEERIETIGQTVGYRIRLENKVSNNTRLTFCTTGILLRQLASNPLLKSVTHIIVDEVHERSEESDFLLLILKRILSQRLDLKIILMSATLNAKLFSDYFGSVPILDIPGRTYAVQEFFLEDILELCDFIMETDSQFSRKINKKEQNEIDVVDIRAENAAPLDKLNDEQLNLSAMYARYTNYSERTCKILYLMEPMKVNPELIESVLRYIVKGNHDWPRTGSILIFLPGYQEIQLVYETLCDSTIFAPRLNQYILIPLHSTLSSEEQAKVFCSAPPGKRKIVLSTNIAETSVTINDCVFVLDYGLMREKRYDSNRNMESLDLAWISRANAQQRKGRAGRVMPGICIHLYTQYRYRYQFLSQPIPEIQRVPLEQSVLRIKTLKNLENSNILEIFGEILEPPSEQNIINAITRLQDISALDDTQRLTPLGHHLSALPVDVRIGKLMLFGAIFQCLDNVLTIAACLSYKSPFVSPFNKRYEATKQKKEFAICQSDHLTCLMAYKKWLNVAQRNLNASRQYSDEHYLSQRTLLTIADMKYQFLELLVSIGFVPIDVPRKRKHIIDNILQLTGADLNANNDCNPLLISLLCASLYPNVVKILTPERSYIQTAGGALPKLLSAKDFRFKTQLDGYVSIHPSSVNADINYFQSAFLVYQEKIKTSRLYIKDCSIVPLVSLVLFAGSDLRLELHDNDFLFLFENGWIIIKAFNHNIAEMIQCLRRELLKILEEKINDPCLNLLNHNNAKKIIQTIVYIIQRNN